MMFGDGCENTGRWSEHDDNDKPLVEESIELVMEVALRNIKMTS